MDSHSSTYEKVLILGDFNVEADDQNMKTFCDSYSLTSLIKQPTCYKNSLHAKCIDLRLTNVPRSFQTTCVIETGLPNFDLMTLTAMRKSFKKLKPRVINYKSYKHFSNEVSKESFLGKLSQQTLSITTMGLKSFATLLLKHWISMLRGRQNMLEAIKCPSWQRIFLKILWKDHGYATNT